MTQITVGSPKVKTQYQDPGKNRVRFKIPRSKTYLHLSGVGETHGIDYAWSGTRVQAQAIRNKALSEGREWPFIAVKAKQKVHP